MDDIKCDECGRVYEGNERMFLVDVSRAFPPGTTHKFVCMICLANKKWEKWLNENAAYI